MAKMHSLAAGALFAWALWAGQPAMGQDPVDGVCDESVRNGCSAGTPNAAAYPDEPVVYQWRCDGLNGGRNSGRCALWFSVVGVCDESVRNGCAAGNPNDDAFPDSPTMYAWRCDGLNAGANSGRCHIRVADVVDGACDDTVRNGCSAGTANDDAIPDNASTYLWRCDGLRGGRNSDKCHIRVADVVDGVCDDSMRNGCSAGTPNDDAIPDNATTYLWRCDGLRGGANSDKCHIRVADVVDGACDDTVRNGCSAGTPNDDAIPDNATTYLWRCDGLRGGRNSDKCHIRVADVVDGVCDDTVRNGCSAGTANDDAFADNSTGYLWRCDGLRGGRNSDKCFIRVEDVPVDGVCDDTVRNGCSAGTANDDAFADNSTGYLWRCDGQHGGRNSDKCFIRVQDVPVDGVCDESVRDGCSAGTANDIAVADTTSHYRWRCDGVHGGANSGTCTRAKPPVAQISCGGSWSPVNSTVCSGMSFTQTRTCNAGCNDGDCSERRIQNGAKQPRNCQWGSWSGWGRWSACANGTQTRTRTRSKTVVEECGGTCAGSPTGTGTRNCTDDRCGPWSAWSAWSPAPSTVACDTSFDQTSRRTRTCNAGCSGGHCEEIRTRRATGTKACPCGNDPWSPATSTKACDTSFTQTRTCATRCNDGDCDTSRPATGTQPRNCQGNWGVWSDCVNFTQSREWTTTVRAGCGGRPCPESPQSRDCGCPTQAVSWSVGQAACAGTLPRKSSGSASAVDTTPTDTGSATYTCTDDVWQGPSATSCTRHMACRATSVSWGTGNACSGSLPTSSGSAMATDTTPEWTGSATYSCNTTNGVWTKTSETCSRQRTCVCTASTRDSETAGTWSDGSGTCTTSGCRVDGVCRNSVRNGCDSGTANDGAVPDTASEYRWRCDGSNGGANSGTCSKAKPTLCGPNMNCIRGATYSYGDCPDSERETPGDCFWFCTLGSRTETCH